MDNTAILKYANEWRTVHGVTHEGPLTPEETVDFARGLQDEVGKFSVRPEPDPSGTGKVASFDADAVAIPYSGMAGDVPGWKIASAMSANGDGRMILYHRHARRQAAQCR